MTSNSKLKDTWKVYMHESPSGKKYIGITSKPLSKRFGTKGQYYKGCPYFYEAIEKYGWDNIKHIILHTNISYKKAIEYEKFYIDKFNANNPDFGYNLTLGGDGASGYFLSEEKKTILSSKRQGVNAIGYNHFPSDETKLKMSKAGKNKTFSKITRQKMSQAKNKRVFQYLPDGTFINDYPSASIASNETKINCGNICSCCRNTTKHLVGGYFWSYEYIDDKELIRRHTQTWDVFEPQFSRNEKPVNMYDLDMKFIRRYDSIKSASLDTNISAQEISQACKNRNKITRKYRWSYAD